MARLVANLLNAGIGVSGGESETEREHFIASLHNLGQTKPRSKTEVNFSGPLGSCTENARKMREQLLQSPLLLLPPLLPQPLLLLPAAAAALSDSGFSLLLIA